MNDRATKTALVSVLEISAGDTLIDRSGHAWPVTAAGHVDGRYEITIETDSDWIGKAYPVDAVVTVLRPVVTTNPPKLTSKEISDGRASGHIRIGTEFVGAVAVAAAIEAAASAGELDQLLTHLRGY